MRFISIIYHRVNSENNFHAFSYLFSNWSSSKISIENFHFSSFVATSINTISIYFLILELILWYSHFFSFNIFETENYIWYWYRFWSRLSCKRRCLHLSHGRTSLFKSWILEDFHASFTLEENAKRIFFQGCLSPIKL